MIQFPNCKINLGLSILSKRPDGFHDIETIMYPVPFKDALEIIPASDGEFMFQSTGLVIPGVSEDNLCVRAFRLLQADFGLPQVKMHLHKVIPVGSGLGGGSSDGAFAIKMLNELFDLGMENEKLKDYARMLGSDCAFFIDDKPVFAFEKGDMFEQTAIDLSGLFLVLVIPAVHVATSDAYREVVPETPKHTIREVVGFPADLWKSMLVNDFEIPVNSKFPVIGKIKQQLYDAGAIYASMSGSGSTVYGLFAEDPHFTISPAHTAATYFGAIL